MTPEPLDLCTFDGDPVNPCKRDAWKNGLCAAHHPDGVKCSATTLKGKPCKNWEWKDGLCKNHNRARMAIEYGRCSARTTSGRQCRDVAARDGYCEYHHPEKVAERRRWEEEHLKREAAEARREASRISSREDPGIRAKAEAFLVAMPANGGGFAIYRIFVHSFTKATISWTWLELLVGDPELISMYSYGEQMSESLDGISRVRWSVLEDQSISVFQSVSDMNTAIREHFDGICEYVKAVAASSLVDG